MGLDQIRQARIVMDQIRQARIVLDAQYVHGVLSGPDYLVLSRICDIMEAESLMPPQELLDKELDHGITSIQQVRSGRVTRSGKRHRR